MGEDINKVYASSVLTDVLFRLYVAVAILYFVIIALRHWLQHPEHITILLVAIVETVTAIIIIFSRRALRRDWRPLSVLASAFSLVYFLALDLTATLRLVPEFVGASFQLTGLALQLYAKLSLGRSFGVLPATRKLVTNGAYRWLRHPIYFGYFVAHLGFLMSNLSLQNFAVIALLCLAQILRIQREEEILLSLPGYREYCARVRYRVVPFVY